MKDESDLIAKKYEAVLKEYPEVTKRLWEQYSKTLEVSPDGSLITNAPASLYEYYSAALEPYVEMQKFKQEAELAKQKAEKVERERNLADRSDIYAAGSKKEPLSEEDREWKEVINEYYTNR
jgi:hypothetical protein